MAESNIMPFVSIVTVNWNGKRFLQKLLPLLAAQDYPKDRYEIIIVDNNSTTDDSVEFVKSAFPDMVLIENGSNDGFAGGCNIGIRASKGDYVMLINNDTEPHKDWLKQLVVCAEKNHSGAVVSKLMFANQPGIINNAGSLLMPDQTWPVQEIGANQKDAPEFNSEREITAFCGASVLLSREMLEQVGIFDEAFFMYFEDGDLSWRAQKAGWKFHYEPASVVMHEHSGSSVEHSDFFTFFVTRNRLLILMKHASWKIYFKALLGFFREFFAVPLFYIIRGRNQRHQLRNLRLGSKILLSLLWHKPGAMLKRWRLRSEARLAA